MTACINKAQLLGFLGEDPVRRDFPHGGCVVTFSLATHESWKDAQGKRQQATEWHRVAIFNEGLGKIAMSYLRKGSCAYVEGEMRSRRWTDRDGQERRVSEVVLPKFRGELKLMDRGQDDAARQDVSGKDRAAGAERDGAPPLDDEVPF